MIKTNLVKKKKTPANAEKNCNNCLGWYKMGKNDEINF